MGGHLFLDENFGQGYVVTEEDEVYLMFSRKKRRLFFPYTYDTYKDTFSNDRKYLEYFFGNKTFISLNKYLIKVFKEKALV